ncbi:related to LipA and NB-ARC domain protein-Aspergillus clavatus, partial [Serendipita indica DSM 11827]
MSDVFMHLTNVLRPVQSSSQTINEGTALADPESGRPSISKSESKIDDLGFLELASGTNPVVDIVAIHGLEGHREKTWSTEDGTLWLRDFLPTDISNARVLSYGYDADTRSTECVSTLTMRRHAEGLAQALSRIRKDSPRRPIIFVAHDLGGIILKWALVICHNQSLASKGELRDILVSTHAILFFGTPHSGVEGTTLLDTINRLTSMRIMTTDVILKDLQSHSSELENIQSLYVAASEKISSIFFCEEYKTSSVDRKRRRLNVAHHSAVIAGDRNGTTIVLHADHESLVRFSNATSDNYRSVLHYLKDYVDSASAAVQEKWITEDNLRSVAKGEVISQEMIVAKPCPPVSRSYVERKEIQSLITERLLPGSVQDQPRCILHGLGGSGKTQLATSWVRKHGARFTRVIFVDASSQTQIEADLERSIRSLGAEYNKMTWKDAVAYLGGKERGWLLFIDNADSPDLNLRPYLP